MFVGSCMCQALSHILTNPHETFQVGPVTSDLQVKKLKLRCPGQVAQSVGAPFRYAKVVSLILGRGTSKNQPMNASISGTTICVPLSTFPL